MRERSWSTWSILFSAAVQAIGFVVELFPSDTAFILRGVCKTLSESESVCLHAMKKGLLCASAACGPRSSSTFRALLPLVDSMPCLLHLEWSHGRRIKGCALAWALETGNSDAAEALSTRRRSSSLPNPVHLGSVRDLISFGGHTDVATLGDELAWRARAGLPPSDVSVAAVTGLERSVHRTAKAALLWASERGHASVVGSLLDDAHASGSSIDRTAVSHALLTACAADRADVVSVLLAHPLLDLSVGIPASGMFHFLRESATTCPIPPPFASFRFERELDDFVVRKLEFIAAWGDPRLGHAALASQACALSVAALVGAVGVTNVLLAAPRSAVVNANFALVAASVAGRESIANSILDAFFWSHGTGRRHSGLRRFRRQGFRWIPTFLAACIGGSVGILQRLVADGVVLSRRLRRGSVGRLGVGHAALWGNVDALRFLLSDERVLAECVVSIPRRGALETWLAEADLAEDPQSHQRLEDELLFDLAVSHYWG